MANRDNDIFIDAEMGNPYAMLGLAYMYHFGKNIKQDNEEALKWYIRSAETGCSRAMLEVAEAYRKGTIVDMDDDLYIRYLIKAAEAGIPMAKCDLSLNYLSGYLLTENGEEAFKWAHSAAEQNSPLAQFLVGYMLGNGIGTEVNHAEQELWYSRAGIFGDADLFYWIGRNFEYGMMGFKVDLMEAGRWYKYGADMGHEKCAICWTLVLNAIDKRGHESLDEREAMLSNTYSSKEARQRAKTLEDAERDFERGNYEDAFEKYQMAADLGSPHALLALGLMHHEGMCVRRNDAEAIRMIKQAALGGSEDAQYVLGTLYEVGRGVKKDLQEAIRHFTQAAANGYLVGFYKLSKHVANPELHVRNSLIRRG